MRSKPNIQSQFPENRQNLAILLELNSVPTPKKNSRQFSQKIVQIPIQKLGVLRN